MQFGAVTILSDNFSKSVLAGSKNFSVLIYCTELRLSVFIEGGLETFMGSFFGDQTVFGGNDEYK